MMAIGAPFPCVEGLGVHVKGKGRFCPKLAGVDEESRLSDGGAPGEAPCAHVPALEVFPEDPEWAQQMVRQLEDGSRLERRRLVAGLAGASLRLALSKHGTSVIQKALEVAAGPDRQALVAPLHGSVAELYRSRFGNFALTKLIEAMPASSCDFVIHGLRGGALAAAKHKFGCRVVERLISHCPQAQVLGLSEELLTSVEVLAESAYGNFVLQQLLEHGASQQRWHIVQVLLRKLPHYASHRYASHVVQKAAVWSDIEGQQAMLAALLSADDAGLIAVASCQSGSAVLEELADIDLFRKGLHGRLVALVPALTTSDAGKQVLASFGLTQTS